MALTSRGKLLVSPQKDSFASNHGRLPVIRGESFLDGSVVNVGVMRNYVFGKDQTGVVSITASATTNFTSPPPAADGVLNSSGVATATFTGVAQAPGGLASAGVSTNNFTGLAQAPAVLASAGVSTNSFTGLATASGVLASAGVSTNAFVGQASSQGVLASAGVSTNSFTGLATSSGESGITKVYLDCCGGKENDVFIIR